MREGLRMRQIIRISMALLLGVSAAAQNRTDPAYRAAFEQNRVFAQQTSSANFARNVVAPTIPRVEQSVWYRRPESSRSFSTISPSPSGRGAQVQPRAGNYGSVADGERNAEQILASVDTTVQPQLTGGWLGLNSWLAQPQARRVVLWVPHVSVLHV